MPIEALDIACEAIHKHPTESRIDANYTAWKALNALQEAGWTIMRFPDMPDEAPDPGGSGPTGF